MESKKIVQIEVIYKREPNAQSQKMNLYLSERKGWGKDELGVWY